MYILIGGDWERIGRTRINLPFYTIQNFQLIISVNIFRVAVAYQIITVNGNAISRLKNNDDVNAKVAVDSYVKNTEVHVRCIKWLDEQENRIFTYEWRLYHYWCFILDSVPEDNREKTKRSDRSNTAVGYNWVTKSKE